MLCCIIKPLDSFHSLFWNSVLYYVTYNDIRSSIAYMFQYREKHQKGWIKLLLYMHVFFLITPKNHSLDCLSMKSKAQLLKINGLKTWLRNGSCALAQSFICIKGIVFVTVTVTVEWLCYSNKCLKCKKICFESILGTWKLCTCTVDFLSRMVQHFWILTKWKKVFYFL